MIATERLTKAQIDEFRWLQTLGLRNVRRRVVR
jgi:hypothetical protein